MKTLTLSRPLSKRGATYGFLYGKGVLFSSMEREWLNNMENISCIPEGRYVVKRDYSGQQKFYKVTNVEDRTLIEFHPANKPQELKGCIALGSGFQYKNNEPNGLTGSRDACNALVSIMGDDDWILHIKNGVN